MPVLANYVYVTDRIEINLLVSQLINIRIELNNRLGHLSRKT